jgi:hypothetical protein
MFTKEIQFCNSTRRDLQKWYKGINDHKSSSDLKRVPTIRKLENKDHIKFVFSLKKS